ncbi:hypothetical protein BGZ65_004339, partial [Modicella reniformis]
VPRIVNVSRCIVMADIYLEDGFTSCSLVANPATTTQIPPSTNCVQKIGDAYMGVIDMANPPTMNRNLTGATGTSGDLLRDLNGNLGIFFAFPDL